jgi:protein involved in polysaccharide export with SLBB domain
MRAGLDLLAVVSLSLAGVLVCGAAQTNEGASATNAAVFGAAIETYRLAAADKLRYSIDEDPVLSADAAELVVTPLGDVSFKVSRGFDTIIVLNVRDKTLDEVKRELKTRLDAEYYHNAQVSLQLVSPSLRIGQVQFFGMVRGPVKLIPGEPKYVSDGILELNYNDFADLSRVKLYRLGSTNKLPRIIDVEKVLKKGDRSQDVILKDGDRIEVPEKGLFFR